MDDATNRVLQVGNSGSQGIGIERVLVASGIGVATVTTPESAVTYVKNSEIRVVLLDEATAEMDISKLAGSLKIANPSLKVIALVSNGQPREYVDAILQKPIDLQVLLEVVQQNLALRTGAGVARLTSPPMRAALPAPAR